MAEPITIQGRLVSQEPSTMMSYARQESRDSHDSRRSATSQESSAFGGLPEVLNQSPRVQAQLQLDGTLNRKANTTIQRVISFSRYEEYFRYIISTPGRIEGLRGEPGFEAEVRKTIARIREMVTESGEGTTFHKILSDKADPILRELQEDLGASQSQGGEEESTGLEGGEDREKEDKKEAEKERKDEKGKEEQDEENEEEKKRRREKEEQEEQEALKGVHETLQGISVTLDINKNLRSGKTSTQDVDLGYYFGKVKGTKNDFYPRDQLWSEVLKLYQMEENKETPDADRLVALHWAEQQLYIPPKEKKSSGGGGNLRVRAQEDQIEITGRPGWEKAAAELPGVESGDARRHMIAWHTLSAAVGNTVKRILDRQKGEEGVDGLIRTFSKLLAVTPEEQKDKMKALAELIGKALTRLNSNTYNLWPGSGYENSLINTYQILLRRWAAQVAGLSQTDLGDWAYNTLGDLGKRIGKKKGKFQATLETLHEVLRQWLEVNPDADGTAFSKFLLLSADNFEFDFPFSPDREHIKHPVALSLIQIAGKFLDWADDKDEAFESKEIDELIDELATNLLLFLHPKGASEI